jgi:glycosyltransferase involved in cell wall biosynthesis
MRRAVVIVDGRMARRRPTGAATYITDLAQALADGDDAGVDVRVLWGPPPLPRRNRLTTAGNLLLDLAWIHVLLPLAAWWRRADVVHAPFNWGPRWCPCPVVVTVQDLAWERVPEAFPAGFRRYARLFGRMSARRAARVIATSASTRDDLIELYRVDPARIRVIPIGVAPPPAAPPAEREPFILAVGEFEPRKRIRELVAGHREYLRTAPPDPPPCRLVLAGAGGSDEAAVRREAGPECELLGFVSDATLHDLYRRATLLVYPSAYEGFGLPVLEAMTHGCPALVARNSSLTEVGADAAAYLDDPTPEGIAPALTELLADRAALAARGEEARLHAARFAWPAVAQATRDVYREVAAG